MIGSACGLQRPLIMALVNKRAAGKADDSPRPLASIESNTSAPHPRRMASSGTWVNKSFLVFSQLVSKNNQHVLEHLTSLADPSAEGGAGSANREPLNTGLDRIHQSGLAIQ